MPIQTKPKPDVALVVAGLRKAAKVLGTAEMTDALAGVIAMAGINLRTSDPHAAAKAHAGLTEVAERVTFKGPAGPEGRVLVVYQLASTWLDTPHAEAVLSVPHDVADQIAPNWRAVAAADSPTGETVGEGL